MTLDLSLIVPCYNEALHLRECVAELIEALDLTRYRYEVVFVDDCSQDDTREILEDICQRTPHCRYILHETNRGRGAAFKTGFEATSGRVTGFIDIDLEVAPYHVASLVNLVDRHGIDIATGHRYYLLSQTRGLHRNLLSRGYRLLCKVFIGAGVRDSETGCKFFNRETAGPMVRRSDSDGWFWDTEVMYRAALANLKIQEMPVLYLRREGKRSSVRLLPVCLEYLKELHRFRGKVGLSLLGKSPLYWTGLGYDLTMRLLYRGEYARVYSDVAELIPPGESVVDVCCGTTLLYRRFLRERGGEYLGLDCNGHFVMAARYRGAAVRLFNLTTESVPAADNVVMCSSLYQFYESRDEVFAKLMAAARRKVIISEPVRNIAASSFAPIASLGRFFTNPGFGDSRHRFDPESFRSFARKHGAETLICNEGSRQAIAIFSKS